MARIRTLGMAAVLVMGLMWLETPAGAALLNSSFGGGPFADTSLSGTTVAVRPELAGVVLKDDLEPFSIPTAGITGWVQNRVVKETVSGTLDFYWRVTVDPTSTGRGVEAFRLGDFGYSYLKDADWRIDGLGSAAPYIARLFNPASPGNRPDGAVNFLFTDPEVRAADPFNPNGGSRFFFVHTDATAYAKTASYDLLASGGQISAIFKTYAPAVPEPGSLAVAAVGMVALGMRRRRA